MRQFNKGKRGGEFLYYQAVCQLVLVMGWGWMVSPSHDSGFLSILVDTCSQTQRDTPDMLKGCWDLMFPALHEENHSSFDGKELFKCKLADSPQRSTTSGNMVIFKMFHQEISGNKKANKL